jgi:hemerythrin-like domain-containing protein
MGNNMNNSDLPEQLPGFDDPIGLLRACHEKMLAHLDLLEGLISTPDAATAQQLVRYFTTSVPLHHRDEEEDLFPRLNRQSMKIAELIYSLKKEHEQLDRLWSQLLPGLKQLPAGGFDAAFIEQANAFCTLCRGHIQRENREFLSLAASSLSQQELGAVGEAMASRRGARYSVL